ncbi:low molecular weight protein-tyrosine-phosphatase [Tenuibacillus multivorans]|nr:low molecular weight protein-tyrosine-phosphatase [Tenuibacillus multivorans]GEL78132.1 low molecular weight protein-tyrosine-phosphatase YfkJ [Tenuibacillus multivorans]
MIKVLFVCLGNICRSPMAEAVFEDLIKKKGLKQHFDVDSAGVSNYHIGELPHEGTIKKLKENEISSEGLKARQFSENDFEAFDYVIAMDDDNMEALEQMMSSEPNTVVKKLLDYLPSQEVTNVPDPFFTGDFEETYQLVSEACRHLLDEIRRSNNM